MWEWLIGFSIGGLEVWLLKRLIGQITAGTKSTSAGVWITVIKFALVLVFLFFTAKFLSLQSMLYAAAGLASAMVGIPIVYSVYSILRYRKKRGAK